MSQVNVVKPTEDRKMLVERVASSRYVNRSARLRDLLVYLSSRVLEEDVDEIHEQEVGYKVFGRAANYDTSSDNIVRVHASMLRKRLEQYFAEEGASEPLVIEIPKGNYAPVFRERGYAAQPPLVTPELPATAARATDRRFWALGLAAGLFACTTAYLVMRGAPSLGGDEARRPNVTLFWSQVFERNRATDIVLDDAAIALYQELTGRTLSLSDYYDRSYLRTLPESAAGSASLDAQTISSVALRRQSSFADISFVWKLMQIPGASRRPSTLRFARDYSFRDLKANNAVLVGNSRSNPWVEPFEPKMGIRWTFDKAAAVYDPVDTWTGKSFQARNPGDQRESFFSVALLPNLGGTGNVLIISGTGGSAINAGADFLADEAAMSSLRRQLPTKADHPFPHFEALIKVKGRSSVPRDATVLLCRPPKP
uniref:Uncharacterized protein n=1 Tax=Solibacter usitatus (strain Ellin6076) TaxID=234267 RepID=Q022Z0_SOLUE